MTRTVELSSEQRAGSASVGDELMVGLVEAPTTGFEWVLVTYGPGLELVDDQRVGPGSAGPPGAAAQRRFRFRAVEPGVARVELELRRSWEKAVADRYSATVTIS